MTATSFAEPSTCTADTVRFRPATTGGSAGLTVMASEADRAFHHHAGKVTDVPRRRRPSVRALTALSAVVGAVSLIACSAQEQVLHGKVSQVSPTVCVAADRALGDCFDPSSVDTVSLGLKVGDCVVVHFVPTQDPTHRSRLTKIEKEQCGTMARVAQVTVRWSSR
jgi:hypothetical protein